MAKAAKAAKAELFSAHGAADLFEKDRQTLVRAMRGIKPDGHERGQPRYKMSTILAALKQHEEKVGRVYVRNGNGHASNGHSNVFAFDPRVVENQRQVDRLAREFEIGLDDLKRVKLIAKRREAALTLAATIENHANAIHERGRIINDEWTRDGLANQIYGQMLAAVGSVCRWTHDQTWDAMTAAMPSARESD